MKEIEGLFDQLAPAPHAIAGQIAADIEIFAQTRQPRVAGSGNREHRTGLRVGLGKAQEVVRQRLWQNNQIGLHIAGSQTRRRAGKLTGPNPQALARAGCDTTLNDFVHPISCTSRSWLFYQRTTS